ncbi:MAG: adenylosuccinate synthase [Candidatus Latescibacterota bacterium]|nr:MAG: adenylosuccinate synthase [Candidatus Latescibacterota bacterium]
MPCRVVLGGQWGDEGKGKIVDYLSASVDAVVRFQGGANAGHTLVVGGERVAVHLVPSGVLRPECEIILGNGMVVDPLALRDEIAGLESAGLDVRGRLRVSTAAHAVLPYHKLQDQLEEQRRGGGGIGTTGRGIGPAYADKAARAGLQLGIFLRSEAEMQKRLRAAAERKLQLLRTLAPDVELDVDAMLEEVLDGAAVLRPLLCDTALRIHELLDADKEILLEGAQGALLDLDHGSYPFVTSSSCTTAGALAGCGVAPRDITSVIGIAKAYSTRVGNGPFPTELADGDGVRLREAGQEFGTTTGRPRRCGWFDAVAVRHAARLSGFTELAITKLDVLDGFEVLRVADAYRCNGETIRHFPSDSDLLGACVPEYLEIEGWSQSTCECRSAEELPAAARRYIQILEERVGVPVRMLSVGPERDATVAL